MCLPQSSTSLNLPAHFGVMKFMARFLGLNAAEAYYKTLPTEEGLAACADRILFDHGFDVAAIHAAARCIPADGGLLVTSNHPSGILDGVLLLSALLSKRSDIRIVANDMLCSIPVLADRVVPIGKTNGSHSRSRNTVSALRSAWKRGECVIVFPAGTVAHWQWREMCIADAPWADGIQRFATRHGIPESRATLSVKNPLWFHGCAALSRKARTALLLRVFFAKIGTHAPHPIAFDLVTRPHGSRLV